MPTPESGGNETTTGDDQAPLTEPGVPGAPTLYGRATDVETVLRNRAPVLLLTADSGVGKSELLRAAQAQSTDAIATAPRTVGRTNGSVQRALLHQLQEATASLIERRGLARQVAERLVIAATELARDRGVELAKAVFKESLNAVKARIGPEAGEALGDYIGQLGEAGDRTVLARLTAANDETVTEVILGFAQEVARLAGDTSIILALDGVDRLGDEDLRLLADIAEQLPEGVHIRAAFSTHDAAQQTRAESLRAVGDNIHEVELHGIGVQAIQEWMLTEGLNPEAAGDVYRATDGYPLVLGDVIEHLKQGGGLEDVPRVRQFTERTQQSWQALDPQDQVVARQLAVLPQPLPERELQSLCGLAPAEWGAAIERLRRARILSSHVNGVPWFHEQRRQAIVDVLRPDEREQLSAAASEAVLRYSIAANAPQLTADVAALVSIGQSALTHQPKTRVAAALAPPELAVAAAALELYEPSLPNGVDGNSVLKHARDYFGGAGNLVDALGRLSEIGLLSVTASRDRTVVVPQLDELSAATIEGRALLELGRLPLPGLASSVFEGVLRPRLLPFNLAVHGAGQGTMRELTEMAATLGQLPFGTLMIGRGQGHNLLLRSRYRERPLSAAVQFAAETDRDAAADQVEGLSLEVLGGILEITDVISHPGRPVPSRRFVNAVERALGTSLPTVGPLRRVLPQAYAPAHFMQVRVDAFELIRQRCSDEERMTMDLEEPVSLHWYFEDGILVQGEVRGEGSESVRHDTLPAISFDDPYQFFRYADAFGLGQGDQLVHLRTEFGQPLTHDPVIEVVGDLAARARQVNGRQARLDVLVEPTTLEVMLLDARRRELADARAIAEGLVLEGEKKPEPPATAVYVLIHRNEAPDEFSLSPLTIIFREVPSPSAEEEVHVAVAPERPTSREGESGRDLFEEIFGVPLQDGRRFSSSATAVVARLLAHSPEDIMLVDKDGRPADAF